MNVRVQQPADNPTPAPRGRASLDAVAASMMVDATPTDTQNGAADAQARGAKDGGQESESGQKPDRRQQKEDKGRRVPENPQEELDDILSDAQDDVTDEDEGSDISQDDSGTEGDDGADDGAADDEEDVLDSIFSDADQDRDADDEGKDSIDTSKLGDDLKLSVTVDGEEQEVTLGELKRRYAGEGAIDKRLQQATEARRAAFEDYDNGKRLVETVMGAFGQSLFRRTVPEPDLAMRESNPTKYLMQKDLYDQETAAIQRSQGELYNLMQQADAQHQERMKAHRQHAAQQLRQIMPVFNDPVKGPKVRDALIEAAREIGYTDADIAACTDPLMFKTVALAARELRRMKGVAVKKTPEKTRTMKSGAQNRGKVSQVQRQQKATMKRARETGSVDDVAASMIVQKKKRR